MSVLSLKDQVPAVDAVSCKPGPTIIPFYAKSGKASWAQPKHGAVLTANTAVTSTNR